METDNYQAIIRVTNYWWKHNYSEFCHDLNLEEDYYSEELWGVLGEVARGIGRFDRQNLIILSQKGGE